MNVSDENSSVNRLPGVILPIVLAALVLALIYSSTTFSWNELLIVSRYAEHFRAGNGLVFNAGEHVLLVPSPLYLLFLGCVATVFPAIDIPTMALVIFGVSLGFGALSIYWLARREGLTAILSTIAALVYFLAWPFLVGLEITTPLAIMFCLLAIFIVLNEHWYFAGIVMTCAILSNPQALLLTIPLIVMASNKGNAGRVIVALALPLVIAVLVLWLYYGTSFWNGLLILKSIDSEKFKAGWYPLLLLPPMALAAWGWFKEHAKSTIALLGVWITLSILFNVLLNGQIDIPLGVGVGAIPILMSVGVRQIRFQSRRLTWLSLSLVGAIVAVALGLGTLLTVPVIGEYIPADSNLSQVHSIALNSVKSLSDLSTSPDQSIVAFDGQLQPELKAMLERGDTQSALIRYAPDVLVVRGAGKIRVKDLALPAIARLGYRPRQEPDTYIRSAAIGSFTDIPITANFGPDITLIGAALDESSLKPGQLLRVRLDWQYARPASQNITIDLRLVSGDGDQFLLAHATDTYDPSIFRAGPYSTYHTLTAIDRAWPGPVTLEAAVIINGGVAAGVPINTLVITGR